MAQSDPCSKTTPTGLSRVIGWHRPDVSYPPPPPESERGRRTTCRSTLNIIVPRGRSFPRYPIMPAFSRSCQVGSSAAIRMFPEFRIHDLGHAQGGYGHGEAGGEKHRKQVHDSVAFTARVSVTPSAPFRTPTRSYDGPRGGSLLYNCREVRIEHV
jgi:hypothetical protein